MTKKILLPLLCGLLLILQASVSQAITMSIAQSGTSVTVTLSATFPGTGGSGRFSINFGDGSPASTTATIAVTGPSLTHTYTASHNYGSTGTYTVAGSWIAPTPPNPSLPFVVNQTISINTMSISPDFLPVARVGEKYRTTFSLAGGTPPFTFRLITGPLPPGLKFTTKGVLEGTPTQRGRWGFTVYGQDASGSTTTKHYTLSTKQGQIYLRVTPASQGVTSQGIVSKTITYEYQGIAIKETMYSTRGEFRAGGALLGTSNKPLSLNARSGKAKSSETIKVPPSVIRRAEQMRTNKITYSRDFKSASLVGKAITTLKLTSGSGDFRITRMRIYFDNNRPRITTAKSSRDLQATVDINFAGTGLLKGYWEVDGRVLQRVQQNIRFGQPLTLKTLAVPPLPTYAEGPHQVRFVITSPAQAINFPRAYYDVIDKGDTKRTEIVLIYPEDTKGQQVAGGRFTWKSRRKAENYAINFYTEEDQEKPFFAAYSKKSNYTMPAQVADKFFQVGVIYSWSATAYDADGRIMGTSKPFTFKSVDTLEGGQ